MKQVRRITALFLCILMMYPTQAMTIFAETDEVPEVVATAETTESEAAEESAAAQTAAAEAAAEEIAATERIEETLAVEAIDSSAERIQETLPIEPLPVWNEEAMIYWNPGGKLPAELASASNATKASASNAKKGRDSADGMSPERPVLTLARALEQAEKLQEELGVESSEITIYAMSPMEVADGQLYVLNGANIRIASWPGRSYDNDTIFYVNGGQLSLINTLLESGNQEDDPEKTQLITVHGGTLQFGQAVEINGQITMDYRKIKETGLWEVASASNTATRSNANENSEDVESFNIDNYILSTDEETAELIEDSTTASTWCKPVIELMEGYEDNGGEYLLTVNTDSSSSQIELVRTLCADELSGEEFLDYFTITYNDETGAEWNLTAETTEEAMIRDTASADTALYRSFEQLLTDAVDDENVAAAAVMSDEIAAVMVASTKSLIATRAGSSTVKYWNPGGKITVSGEEFPAGSDSGYDGNSPNAPYKTWEKAVANANGGTIICMQSVTLGSGAQEYIGSAQADGSYLIQSSSRETMVTLMVWEAQPRPAFIVPSGETLVLKNIELSGIYKEGVAVSTQTVLCQSGDVVIDENVAAETGYIQVDAFSALASHPVIVNSIAAADDGIITLFFGGINNNLSYRFTDVVVPGTALAADVTADADAVGQALLARVILDTANRDAANGGQSSFDWTLRQDTTEDDAVAKPQNLELYVDYFFDAVYLDGVRGDDSYYGATCQYPVKTWGRAYEIWAAEIDRSIAARAQAGIDGMSTEYIEANIPVPTVIYICGTVTVDRTENWKLVTKTDYNGDNLITEVRSHVDIPYGDNGTTLVHQIPKVLAEVKNGGNLTIEDITIRNDTGEKDSITLQADSGGTLTLTGDTLLTGERLESVDTLTAYQEVTEGTHVQVTAGGTFVMDADWDGAIERREHGVEGVGVGAQITMNGGEIRKNNSYDETLFEAKDINQLKGAGVVLSNKAAFVMNGGKITGNTVYQYGAGVYLTGNGTSFTMNKGEVSENQMAGYLSYYGAGSSAESDVHGYGIGIYAETGTVVTLGSSTSNIADTLVTRNTGYWADGIGVWTDGTLNVGKATISENYNSTGGYSANVKKGLGIYAGGNARVTIDGAVVTGNYSAETGYGNAQGAGIYLEYNTNGNVIKNSRITGNIVGYENNTGLDYNGGGGIFLDGGVLEIADSVLENNGAYYGGGIMAYSTSTAQPIALTVSGTSINNNKARYFRSATSNSGIGGGIYGQGYGVINLESGTRVNENESMSTGGGMYLYGYSDSYHLKTTITNSFVNLNTSYSNGAGINTNYYTTVKASSVNLEGNTSTNGSGGAVFAYSDDDNANYATKLYFDDVIIKDNKAANGAGIGSTRIYYVFMYFNRVDIKDNEATSGSGGGIYTSWAQMYFNQVEIENNTAAASGGGIYCGSSTILRFLEVNIKDNTATSGDGGGCYINYGTYHWTDTRVTDNTAGGMGGGMYLYGSGTLYFYENAAGGSALTRNTAASGGGIYSGLTAVHLDIDGEYQNMATVQGSNLYLGNGSNYIYTGKFKQPLSQSADVYNIYLNVTSTTSHALYMDPQSVEIEKKTGSEPDAVYLNTTNSFLSYIQAPLHNNYGTLPIDVNTEVFKAGSIVVKPAKIGNQSLTRVTIGTDGYATSTGNYTKNYTALTDAVINVDYSSGGDLPRRTQLGGYNGNIVIIDEGVYLSTSTGDDNNGGSSPEDAVATFARARQILKERILATEAADALETDPSKQIGFSPFIYICGNVLISSDETWELDYDDPLYYTNNVNYRTAEGENAYDAQVRRFASFVDQPMITVGSSESAAVEFTTKKIIIDGMADAVVINDQSSSSPVIKVMNQSKAILTGNSRITNNYSNGVDVYGSLVLTGGVDDENKQLLNHHGYYVRMMASNANLEMNGYSRIAAEGEVTRIGSVDCYGVYSSYQSITVLLKDNSSICRITTDGNLLSDGMRILGKYSAVLMQDLAEIQSSSYGIYVNGASSTIGLEDSAKITSSSYGIYLYSSASDSTVSINKNTGAQDGESAQIVGYGILSYTNGATIEMGKDALLKGSGSKTGYGVYFQSPSATTTASNLIMEDNSRITNFNTGVYFAQYGSANQSPVKIVMKDYAAIDQNTYGMYESTSSSYGINSLDIVMEGSSRISGNSSYGISLTGYKDFTSTAHHNITMTDNAIIGGLTTYSVSDASSGNQYTGIYANSPINLEMSGSSKISGNGYSTSAGSYSSANAVTLIPFYYNSSQSYLRATETAHITLKENASICNNKGGIYVQKNTSYPLNPCEIILDGSGGVPSIQENTDAVYLMGTDQIIKLQGNAILGSTTYQSDNRALDCYGSLELDGRSQINGLTYLRTAAQPITMTQKVSDPARKYRLWLAEGFLGQIVVQPDDPDGTGGGITDVTDQLDYFTKAGAEGMAADKELKKAAPNIILMGENNVYLSGNGNDTNSGNSPSTPVRTFQRAKELLAGAGYYTSGANIVICSSAVTVLAGDDDWSFDSDGKVTNSQSGESWKPAVIRYKDYTIGKLIELTAGTSALYANTVTFKNITIDGGSADGITATNSYSSGVLNGSELLFVGYGRTAILAEGAVLQNNTIKYDVNTTYVNRSSVGVLVYGGTLEIEGGIIQNMVRTSTITSSSAYYMGSALYCYPYSAVYPGKVTMKSGQIINNTISMPNKSGGLRAGAVSVEDQYATFDMSGGLIANNQVITKSGYKTTYGAGLVSYNANTTISGGIIRGNEGVQGSAIYYYGSSGVGSIILSGGQITGNITNESGKSEEGIYSPVFVSGWDFQLNGGGTDFQDNIYLNSTENIIKVSGNIYQTGRIYHLFLNQAASSSDTTKFQKGSAVVQPDGNWITDVTPYLSYFRVHSNPYILDAGKTSRTNGTVSGIKENQCLILMHAVFLDSDSGKGNDGNNGTTPGKAVETFTRAQAVGRAGIGSTEVSEYYVIYISGKATNTAAESLWTLPEPAYMCRYTGFQIYNSDGSEVSELFYSYHGYLIEPSYNLTLDGVTVYGRRSADTVTNNGDSLVNVKDGITVTVKKSGEESTTFGRNYNQGEYSNPDNGSIENLSSKGGAFHVEAGGNLYLLGGIISDTSASYGSAVYLEADQADASKFGHLHLSGSPSISGTVYLSGTGSTTAAYIEPEAGYLPVTALNIVIGNDYDGRWVVRYTDGTTPGYDEKEYYNLEDSIKALYDVVNNNTDSSVLQLEIRHYLYLDGQNGNDTTGDGKTPETAFQTIKRVYQAIAAEGAVEGTLVFVVDTVDFNSTTPAITLSNILIRNPDGTSSYQGWYSDGAGEIDINGQVYFKRYAQPDGYDSTDSDYTGYNRPTLKDTLFRVKSGGNLTLNGIYLDGHSQDSDGADKRLVAAGVEAESPLVTVLNGGVLTCSLMEKSTVTNGVDTATVFTNNVNVNQKSNTIGTLDGSEIIEGSSAGIELLGGETAPAATSSNVVGSTNGGKAVLKRTQFSNLSLGSNVVSGGTDVYSYGDLHFSDLTFFSGTVFIEGFGEAKDEDTYITSHYLTVDLYGEPAQADFQVLMRDPYNERTVVYYAPEGTDGPVSTQVGRFRLEERVKDYFYLAKRDGAPYVLELTVPVGVYIDGLRGTDELDDLVAGSTPDTPVKSLKRAFELLYTRSGNTIYVVGPIQITGDTYVTGTTYTGTDGTITLGSTDKVKITRYIQPDFAYYAAPEDEQDIIDAGYSATDYQGVLLEVKDGATASFGTNVYFDGHSKPKIGEEYRLEGRVSREDVPSKAPLIKVESGGALNLYSGTTLMDNLNTYDSSTDADGMDGGVIYNSGTTVIDGALFDNNHAAWGSGVYQDGTFIIRSAPENMEYHSFYLTTENTGTDSSPVWGTDHIIQTYVAIPDDLTYDIDMDHAVKGRDVVQFLDNSAYDPDVDAENKHFILGSTVPNYLFLVQAVNDETILELQNWEVLDVNVPSDIYLVIHRSGSLDTTTKLSSVRTEAAGTDLLTSPEYTIKNNGRYDVKVSVIGFENQNDTAGITANGHEKMTLVDAAMNVFGETDLYLGIQGMDSGSGLTMAETSLQPYAEPTVTAAPAELGILNSGTSGSFKFTGAVGTGFIEKYIDSTFPISGETRENVQKYMDGTSTSGVVNARAKYAMKFKLEIDPARLSGTGSSTSP